MAALDLTIRPALAEDLPAVTDIYNDAVLNTTASYNDQPRTAEASRAWLLEHQQGSWPVLVAASGARTVGWASLSEYRPQAGYRFTAENSVYVAADCRGQGIGGALLGELIQAARRRRVHAILAVIDSTNAASVRLHARFGFEQVGCFREVGYKFGRWLDVVFMELLVERAPRPEPR